MIHIDFVGPLPQIKSKKYLCTIFDRATRWFYAYPSGGPTTESAINALLNWISHFGVPEIIISDQGTHFESRLFQEISRNLGIEKRKTTPYHPSANGAVERQHRRLKDALKAKSANAKKDWLYQLPLLLLGLNNTISEDTGYSPAQAVYNRQLDIPNCIFENQFNINNYVPPKRNFERRHTYVPKELYTCTYVWLRKPGQLPSLERPYTGPYKVITKNFKNNTIEILINNNAHKVSLERVKPALGIISDNILSTKIVTFKD